MGSFDDLDDALLELVLKWLNSTELRSAACLVCKRWLATCNSRPGLWRDLDINVSWEVARFHGLRSGSAASTSRAVHRGGRGSYSRNQCHRYGTTFSGSSAAGTSRPHRLAFLSRTAISRWLQQRAPPAEILRISNTELRITVVGYGSGSAGRHDLQPSDLMALLAALPSLTELHLISACNLLPEPSALLRQPPPPPPPAMPLPTLAAAAAPPAAAVAFSQGVPWPALAAAAGGTVALPLADRLRRLSLRSAGYEFESDEGVAQVAALGGLRQLQELTITLEPPTEEGLGRLPDSWSALTCLTALRLGGHQRLRRLPSWLSRCLTQLRELELEDCGLRRVPAAAVAGLRELRRLNMDRCPLGRGSPAVSLDAWWPPEESGSGGGGGGGAEGQGGGGGMAGLEVLQLRHCDILALPYTMTRLTNLRRLELGSNPLGDLALLSYETGRAGSEWGRRRGGTGGNGGGGGGGMRSVVLRYLQESGDRGFGQLVGLPRLRHLGLENCGLARVPMGVDELTQLTSLDLSHNPQLELDAGRVVELPGRLPQLACLRLGETAAGQQLREAAGLNLGVRDLDLE